MVLLLSEPRFDVSGNQRKFDAVLLDIDHSPRHLLDAGNRSFYGAENLGSLGRQIKDSGVFALWSNEAPDGEFTKHLASVFGMATAQTIEFTNLYTNSTAINSVYVAHKRAPSNL